MVMQAFKVLEDENGELNINEVRFLPTRMKPRPSEDEIDGFIKYHQSKKDETKINPEETLKKMDQEVIEGPQTKSGKKGKKGKTKRTK